MPIDVIMQKVEGRLVPRTNYDAELIDELPLGKDLRCKITVSRSEPLHRWYWLVLSKVVDNTDQFTTTESLHFFLKIRSGRIQKIELHDGSAVLLPKSTSFGSMDDTEFKAYVEDVKQIITQDILVGTTIDELMDSLNDA
jgi:hypothetical protein